MKMFFAVILFLSLFFTGCGNTKHCFTIEGSHDETGIGGAVTWCIDPDESKDLGETVVVGPNGDKSVLLSIEKIEEIANRPKANTESKNGVAVNALRSKSWREALRELK